MTGMNEKISWQETLGLNLRAVRTWHKDCPMLFLSAGLFSLAQGLSPYLTLYFSARILNELAGGRRAEILFRQVITLLLAGTAAQALKAAIFRWKTALAPTLFACNQRRTAAKLLSLDFSAADDTATHEMRNRIFQTESWSGWGIQRVYYYYQDFLEALFKMAGAVALSFSFFTLQVKEAPGWLSFLNHPLAPLLLVLIMAGITVLSPWLEAAGNECWNNIDDDMKVGNLLGLYYIQALEDPKKALDMRIYRQEILGLKYYRESGRFIDTHSRIAKAARGKMGASFALSSALSRIFMGICYLFVCLKAWGGAFGAGSATQYIGAITALSQGLSGMLKALGDAKVNSPSLKTTFQFLDIPSRMYHGSLTVEKRSDKNYEVEFQNVSFRYPGAKTDALKNISIKFRIGMRLAVVGENGSGKTTFIKLLCRLYDPTEGKILLNGIDIRKYNYQEYMDIFSVVFQDFQLLSFPLGENVGAGENYHRERALECLEKAGFSARAASLPKGLDTPVYKDFDDSGIQVSGGEAQKIAIARALYREAPFIILDEPTAALDPMAEYEIYTKFNEIIDGRTAIYISHRLASCRFCDEILVFSQGRVDARGDHDTLLAQGGKYCQLWNAQAQYYTSPGDFPRSS